MSLADKARVGMITFQSIALLIIFIVWRAIDYYWLNVVLTLLIAAAIGGGYMFYSFASTADADFENSESLAHTAADLHMLRNELYHQGVLPWGTAEGDPPPPEEVDYQRLINETTTP